MESQYKNIKKSLDISPDKLDQHILQTVESEIRERYEKTCDKRYGLLISIDRFVSVENFISKDSSSVTFTVTFDATTFNPVKGMEIVFKPTSIISRGVFGKLYDRIFLFIPDSFMGSDWIYAGEGGGDGGFFSNKKTKKSIRIGCDTKARIVEIRYEIVKYNCICSINI